VLRHLIRHKPARFPVRAVSGSVVGSQSERDQLL